MRVHGFCAALRAVRLFAGVLVAAIGAAVLSASPPAAQEGSATANQRRTLDQILDIYVRDGLVYYRALKSDSAKLSAYIASIAEAPVDSWSTNERLAFWLNAYDAVVLKTVIEHYPIPRRSADYPAGSIRQIPGAFERLQHRIGRRSVTLDDIETKWLADFKDPRVFLAIGRGAVGGGRLRSEAFNPAAVEMQLSDVAAECVSRSQCIAIDRVNNRVLLNAIFSWRSQAFIDAFANSAPPALASRSPIERAGLALVAPHLLGIEKEFLAKNEFKVDFAPFDWTLNDLTGRGR